jgi:hypothetical protein
MLSTFRAIMTTSSRRRRSTDATPEPWWVMPLEILIKQGVGAVVAIIIVVWWTRDASARLDVIAQKTDEHVRQMQQMARDEDRDRQTLIQLANLQCSYVAKNDAERSMCNDVVDRQNRRPGGGHP